MNRTIYVSVYEGLLTRVAVTRNGELLHYEAEAEGERPLVGQIHRCEVSQVARGLDAVYVSLGNGLSGFLHRSDVFTGALSARGIVPYAETRKGGAQAGELPKPGTAFLVQVKREAFPGKEPQVTTDISFPGCRMVLRPYRPIRRISKALKDRKKRDALHAVLRKLPLPARSGVIVRTAGTQATKEELREELLHLTGRWEQLVEEAQQASSPQVVYQEEDILERVVRDFVGEEQVQILVNHRETRDRLKELVAQLWGEKHATCQLHRGTQALFVSHKVAPLIEDLYNRRLSLPGGGSLVIEYAEGFTAVDVNTGGGLSEAENTALATNLEAAGELFRQMRLRDMGGLIVCDFVTMQKGRSRKRLQRCLAELARQDPGHVWVGPVTKFGVVALTRRSRRQVASHLRLAACPVCRGAGWTLEGKETAARFLDQLLGRGPKRKTVAKVTPALRAILTGSPAFEKVQAACGENLVVEELPASELYAFHFE